ncbi:hypothetical protein BU14_0184s0018 [Porphyra umbilicalis]|uniref:CNNM transmembrane domain-containing protein n=1 Tax=Porphyra umbilicalis TaxID=2786 RepID=A0A1X6P6S2_PORUM|nr:hypothetical protein BU14_0184s0018 [Porphyra umbilicalis]|eukprot:OSX76591.1 hypothetical protein BU14_0184s0018 [Porphyra umbilicalis]
MLFLLALGCLVVAALVAGLTLGLMSLDMVGLEIMAQSHNPAEAAAARRIQPVRKQGNLLLVTLLLTNTLASELLPLVLETLYPGGPVALVVSVLSLMLFGEVIPQAVCSRHALQVGAWLIGFVKVLRAILLPLAWPIAAALDAVLGEEIGTVYSRHELSGLIDAHSRNRHGVLTEDETTILKGTLTLSAKTVADVLTRAEDVFCLDVAAVLDRPTMKLCLRKGHSRVPLYEGDKANIVGLLLLKQLILIDPDDKVPVRALISKKKKSHKVRVSPPLYVSADTALSELLNEFKDGRSHMALVYDDINKPDGERVFLGAVTLEDIVEEILAEEIIDETDRYVDNVSKQPVLERGSDGRLVRRATVLAQQRISGTGTILLKEIDVQALKSPLAAKVSSALNQLAVTAGGASPSGTAATTAAASGTAASSSVSRTRPGAVAGDGSASSDGRASDGTAGAGGGRPTSANGSPDEQDAAVLGAKPPPRGLRKDGARLRKRATAPADRRSRAPAGVDAHVVGVPPPAGGTPGNRMWMQVPSELVDEEAGRVGGGGGRATLRLGSRRPCSLGKEGG